MEHILSKKKVKVEKNPRPKQQQNHPQIYIPLIVFYKLQAATCLGVYMVLLRLSPTNTAGKIINL